MRLLPTAALALALALLGACGQTGPLYHPEPEVAAGDPAAGDPAAGTSADSESGAAGAGTEPPSTDETGQAAPE